MSTTDDRIRAVLGSLADRAPLPPDIEAIRQATPAPLPGGVRRTALLAAIAVGAALLAFLAVRSGPETPIATGGTTRLAPRDVPADLRLVSAADLDQFRYPGTSLTYTSGPESFEAASRALAVHVTVVPADDVDQLRDPVSPLAERLEVRGHDAELFDDDPGLIAVVWVEDELVVSVNGRHLSRQEVLAAAESLEPISDEEWEGLRR
jgi:hypothetical protein